MQSRQPCGEPVSSCEPQMSSMWRSCRISRAKVLATQTIIIIITLIVGAACIKHTGRHLANCVILIPNTTCKQLDNETSHGKRVRGDLLLISGMAPEAILQLSWRSHADTQASRADDVKLRLRRLSSKHQPGLGPLKQWPSASLVGCRGFTCELENEPLERERTTKTD